MTLMYWRFSSLKQLSALPGIVCLWVVFASPCFGRLYTNYIFTVPSGYVHLQPPGASFFPFSQFYFSPVHYQQVFDASAFQQLPKGGAFLISLSDHSHCADTDAFYASNVVMRLSTTAAKPDKLSLKFLENIGLDETVVLDSKVLVVQAGGGRCDTPLPNRVNWYSITTPFFYNPADGNLLLDWQLTSTEKPLGFNDQVRRRAGVTVLGDEISGVADLSLTSTTASIAVTAGVVYQFVFAPMPNISIVVRSNDLFVQWPQYPEVFRLQTCSVVGNPAAWVDYPADQIFYVDGEEAFSTSIPLAQLDRQRFFRLYWNSPQPGVPSPGVRILNSPEPSPVPEPNR